MTREELLDEDDYEDLLDDIACEVEAKFGALASWAPQVWPCPRCFFLILFVPSAMPSLALSKVSAFMPS